MIISIVGLSGSGKSIIAQTLENYSTHIIHIDIDKIGHLSHQDPQVKQQLIETFGNEILTNKEIAVKITYENGDYEVFSHNSREEYRVGNEFQNSDAYIGVFDYEQFYSLLFEYTES